MPSPVHIDAPAKINLGLAIRGRREDGYHDLISVFQAVSWTDRITLSDTDEDAFTCNVPTLSTRDGNLVWNAVELTRAHFGIDSPVSIHLKKDIPWGSGLGGGSSDAAATFRGLATLWHLNAERDVWMDLHAGIGSDVPFFHFGGAAVVTGRGEFVEPLPSSNARDLRFVVAVPPVTINTGWAFQRLAAEYAGGFPDPTPYERMVEDLRSGAVSMTGFIAGIDGWNTFQTVVEEQYTVVRDIRRVLTHAGASVALLSGSGSAVFGVFESSPDAAERALTSLPDGTTARIVTAT
jgi:4-diphosphocytidyl-2-C-methyl-D-erythritol kinase